MNDKIINGIARCQADECGDYDERITEIVACWLEEHKITWGLASHDSDYLGMLFELAELFQRDDDAKTPSESKFIDRQIAAVTARIKRHCATSSRR